MSWFKELFGYEAGERPRRDLLILEDGQEIIAIIEIDTPRLVETRFGRRAFLDIKVNDEPMTLPLGHKDLAEKIALLEKEHNSLKGLVLKIKRLGRIGRRISYLVEVVEGR